MSKTKIHWADCVINPIVGCSKISTGCQNCYAEKMARRLAYMHKTQYESVTTQSYNPVNDIVDFNGWNGRTAFVSSEMVKPYKWKKPRSIFVCSMGDLFHESVPFEWIDQVMHTVHHNPQHTFIFLTKRPANMKRYFDKYIELYGSVVENLVLGVSVEDQETANERISILLQILAAKRFISIEPTLGPIDLAELAFWVDEHGAIGPTDGRDPDVFPDIHGVILGGESGPRARPLDPDWVRQVRDQCAAAQVPFMFKQGFGEKFPIDRLTGFPKIDGRTHTDLCWVTNKRTEKRAD